MKSVFRVSSEKCRVSPSCTMCSVSVVTVVFIHTMEDDQRLDTLVHEGVICARLTVVSVCQL